MGDRGFGGAGHNLLPPVGLISVKTGAKEVSLEGQAERAPEVVDM